MSVNCLDDSFGAGVVFLLGIGNESECLEDGAGS